LKYDHRLIIDTILYVLVSGCACLFVPLDLDPWHAAYRWFRHSSALGVGGFKWLLQRGMNRPGDLGGLDYCTPAGVTGVLC